jgi:ParB-like chromosome segregation protein Spo0J
MATVLEAPVERVPIDQLVEYPGNPRHGDDDATAAAIEDHGFYGTLIRQASTGYLLAGHTRLRAARRLGLTELPVQTLDVDDATARRILAADNRTSDLATYDDQLLADLLEQIIAEGELAGTGYTDDDYADTLTRLEQQENQDIGPGPNTKGFQPDIGRADATRRIMVFDFPVTQFAWMVERLDRICTELQVASHQDAMMRLVAERLGDKLP